MSTLSFTTPHELQILLGERLRRLRLNRNLDQLTTAEKAGVSEKALRNLEAGRGSTVETLLRVLKALDPLQRIERLQHAQQRFDGRSPAGFEIAQGLFRNAGLLGGRELIEVAVQTQAPQPLTEEDLEFVRGGEGKWNHKSLVGNYALLIAVCYF